MRVTPRKATRHEDSRASVAVRIRPPIGDVSSIALWTPDEADRDSGSPVRRSILCARGSLLEEHSFDRVFGPAETNLAVFQALAGPRLVRSVLSGYHESFFAYGQTGSGKTHAIFGADPMEEDPELGILHLVIQQLYEEMAAQRKADSAFHHVVQLSCFEILGDTLTDLLPADEVPEEKVDYEEIYLKTNKCRYSMVRADDARTCLDLVDAASAKRMTGVSHLNLRSSRSHCIVKFVVRSMRTSSVGALGQLCLVDLAGSEKEFLNPTEGGKRVARTLNTSLSSLNRLLRQLQTEGGLQESDRRQGALNRVLYDHCKSGCGISMLFCVNPELESLPESLSTLQMAAGSQLVRNQRKQQFISVQGEFYNLGSRRPCGASPQRSGVPLSSPSNASTPRNILTPGGRGDFVEDSVDSTTAAPDSTEDGHAGSQADAQMKVAFDENRSLRAKLENLASEALEQLEVKKELTTKVQLLESQCSAFQRQLAVHEEYFQAMHQDQATLTTATPRSSQSQLASVLATPCLPRSVSEAPSQATPTREGSDGGAERQLEAAFWRQEAERLQVELDSMRTGIPTDQLRSIRCARRFWGYTPAERAALTDGVSPARSRSSASAAAEKPAPPAAGPAGDPPLMPVLDAPQSESEEDSADPRPSDPAAGPGTPPRTGPGATPPRTCLPESSPGAEPAPREANAVPCVALTLTSPVEHRDAKIQTRDSPVPYSASREDVEPGPQTPKDQSQLELTSTSVFEETPGALTFALDSDGSPGVPGGPDDVLQLDTSLVVEHPDDDSQSQVSASVQSGRSRCLDRRPGANRESVGRELDRSPARCPRRLTGSTAAQPVLAVSQPRYPVKRRYWTAA